MASEKEIHVNGYVKRDGTEVSEYYRSAPEGSGLFSNSSSGLFNNNSSFGENSLFGPVEDTKKTEQTDFPTIPETQDIPQNSGNYQYSPDSVFNSPVGNYLQQNQAPQEHVENQELNIHAFEAEQQVNDVLNSIKYMDKNQMRNELMRERTNKMLEKITQAHNKSREFEQQTLDKLINSPNQQEYQKTYKTYIEIKVNNDLKADNLNRIKFAAKNNNIPMLYNELNNYKSDFDTVAKTYRQKNPLKNPEKPLSYYTTLMHDEVPINHANNYTYSSQHRAEVLNDIHKKEPKYAIDIGMWGKNWLQHTNKINDAKEMWKASSHDFTQSKDYVNKNGSLLSSISDLKDKELQNIVKNKVKNSYGADDSVGMIFNSNSNLSKEMANSPEYKKLFLENKNELLNYQVVKNKSGNFSSSKNLELAIRKFDVPYMFIDANGDFCTVAMDAYDFQPGEDWKIDLAAKAQNSGSARKYYTLHVTRTPKAIWEKW